MAPLHCPCFLDTVCLEEISWKLHAAYSARFRPPIPDALSNRWMMDRFQALSLRAVDGDTGPPPTVLRQQAWSE